MRYHFPTLPSTHLWAKEHASEIHEFTRITADEQTAGIGQFGKPWHSPLGNLHATFCFTVPNGWQEVIHTAQLLALSVTRALPEIPLRIKWPNDLLLDKKKVGGILAETLINKRTLVLASLGLNVHMKEFGAIDQPATSLARYNLDLETLIQQITDQFSKDLDLFLKEGFGPFQKLFNLLHSQFLR